VSVSCQLWSAESSSLVTCCVELNSALVNWQVARRLKAKDPHEETAYQQALAAASKAK
jgi:hypothetical protein